jgi:superfamily II DNA/RNA helicase
LNEQNAFPADDTVQSEAEPAPRLEAPEADADLPLFTNTGLSEPILRAVLEKGYTHPTPIQAQAIPVVLAGRDVLAVAQTGTGKTASFTLPMLDILSGSRARARMPRSLILEPTRELALQVAENFVQYGKYTKLTHALLIGGESLNDQRDVLTRGVDVLIATPGRLLDLFERGGLLLTDCRVLVIDEADRMLDMGFIPDVEKIVSLLPKTRQTLFFSATMAPEIRRLVDEFLQNPKTITVSRAATVATTIIAGLSLVAEHDKREALRRLIRSEDVQNALIFCNRKRDADVLHKSLVRHEFSAGILHGDLAQSVRFATLEKFKANDLRLLVCSDVAARGIDIGGLSHVFNFDVPYHAEDYVHRIGRTGRAGKEGHAYTLATPDDRLAVEAIEKLIGAAIPRIAIPGLDVVEWAEGKPRSGRGRSGGTRTGSARTGNTSPAPVPKPKPAKAPPRPAPVEKPEPVAVAESPRPPPARQDRAPREYRRRDDDLGPSVTGFGEDIPAFMLLPRRATFAGHDEAA